MKAFPPRRTESKEILTEKRDGGGDTPYGAATPVDDAPPAPKSEGFWRRCCPLPRRHYVSLLAFLGFCNIYALRVNLTIAILEMTKNVTNPNRTIKGRVLGEFYYWDSVTVGGILGSFFYGYILTQLPGGWLAGRWGGRTLFGLGVFGTALLTLLTPPLAHMGKVMLIAVRVAEGLCEGVTYPAIHALWRQWAPPMEKTKLATFAFAGSYFGTVISMPLSAALGESWGWPSIFYVFGLMALLWCSVWFKTVKDSPAEDPRISKAELEFIQRSIGFTVEQVKNLKPPWKAMFSSTAVWAIVAAHFAENWGFYTMLTYLPKYMEDVLDFKLRKAGFAAAIPYLAMGVAVMSGGQLADYLRESRNWSTGLVRKVFCCSAFLCQTLFILITAHIPNHYVAVGGITLGIGCGGFAWAGFSVNPLDIAPQFASVVMGLSNTFATLPGMIAPVVVGAIVQNGDLWQWRMVFYLVAAVYTLGAGLYFVWSSGEQQPWADVHMGYTSQLSDLGGRVEEAPEPVTLH